MKQTFEKQFKTHYTDFGLTELKNKYLDVNSRIDELNDSLKSLLSERATLHQKINDNSNKKPSIATNVNLKIFDILIKSGKYSIFNINNPVIVGITTDIIIKGKDGKKMLTKNLGPMKVSFNMHNIRSGIKIRSIIPALNYSGLYHCHPHVFSSGTPCLGNMYEPIKRHRKEKNYGLVFQILHDYLSSYNDNDAIEGLDEFQSKR